MATNIAMQLRCVHCKREQYAVAVMSVSRGESGCAWCGKMSKKMSVEEYRNALTKESI